MADLEAKLDLCIDRLQAGEDLESVLRSYPESADELRTLLQMAKVVQAMRYTPSAEKKLEARRRFESVRAERGERDRSKKSWFAGPLVWGMVATVAVVVFAVYIGVRPAFSPGAPVFSDIVPVASPAGNFAFLVSDEVNAIAEFSDVTVDISKIGIQQSSDGKWIEISPSMQSIDLTEVPGDLSEEIWRGDLPPGSYSQAFVYVDNVSGALEVDRSKDGYQASQPETASADSLRRFRNRSDQLHLRHVRLPHWQLVKCKVHSQAPDRGKRCETVWFGPWQQSEPKGRQTIAAWYRRGHAIQEDPPKVGLTRPRTTAHLQSLSECRIAQPRQTQRQRRWCGQSRFRSRRNQ